MLPLRINISDQARVNLLEIWTFLAEDNVKAAESVYDRIRDKIAFLAENPAAGRSREDLRPGLRSFPVGQYLIFYVPFDKSILISRIVH